jgi:hypothetical protein
MQEIRTPATSHSCFYSLGDVVYHRLVEDRFPGMVTYLLIKPIGVVYGVTWPNRQETQHYEIELSSEYVPDYGQ